MPGHEAHQRRAPQTAARGRARAEEQVAGPVDRHREQDCRQSREHADDDREREEQLVLAQPELLESKSVKAHHADPPRGAGQ